MRYVDSIWRGVRVVIEPLLAPMSLVALAFAVWFTLTVPLLSVAWAASMVAESMLCVFVVFTWRDASQYIRHDNWLARAWFAIRSVIQKCLPRSVRGR